MSPILLAIAAAVAVMMGRPVLFVQRRLGLDGTEFELIKFRTMTMATSEDGTPLPEKERLTAFGSLLRQTSLDELPELFNIAKGEMAFVGPRPLPVRYRDRYSPEEFRRHAVLPGRPRGTIGSRWISGTSTIGVFAWTLRSWPRP